MIQQFHTSRPSVLEKHTLCSQEGTCKDTISVLLVIEQRKQCTYSSVGEWLPKGWYIFIMDAVILYKLTWKELQEMLSEKQVAEW